MIWLATIVAILVAAILIVALLKRPRVAGTGSPYVKADRLFSAAERSFLGVLEQATGKDLRVLGKVRVADVVALKKGLSPSDRQRAFNRISSKHFDFIICAPDDLSVLGAIELDDRSHSAKRRRERDQLLADICSAISLPLLRVTARGSYSIAELRRQISSLMIPCTTHKSESEAGTLVADDSLEDARKRRHEI